MRSLGERFHILKKLINLRLGPGAAILPPDITQIHLDFAMHSHNGHMGARKFWRENLPRLKYNNPSIPMIVNRHEKNDQTPLLIIYMRLPTSAAPKPLSTSATDATLPADAGVAAVPPLASSTKNLCKPRRPAPDERTIEIDMRNRHSSIILEEFLEKTGATLIQATPQDVEDIKMLQQLRVQGEESRKQIDAMKWRKKQEADMLKRARALAAPEDEDAA